MRAARGWVSPLQRVENITLNLRLPASLVAELDAYAEYVGGESDRRYVAHQIVASYLARDKEFRNWLESRPTRETPPAGPAPVVPPRP